MKPKLIAALLLILPAPAFAQESLQQRVETVLRAAGPGPRFGLLVVDDAGKEIVAIDPDGRYIPASNTKMFTTAAAFANLPVDQPDASGGAAVRLDTVKGRTDVVLIGNGDARLSSAADCAVDCLATLADAVAAKTRKVRDVIGDDTLFPDQRWSPGMSWNNIPTRSGTATSALTLDDNELVLTVTPGTAGAAPKVEGLGYYTVDNRAVTVAPGGKTDLAFDREPNTRLLRLTGTILADAAPEKLRLGIDDPAHYAAWRLKALLEERGVRVKGKVSVRHRRLATDPVAPPAPLLAQLTPPPLAADLVTINKVSQNLHAELAMRRLGRVKGSGSIADGVVLVREMLTAAGAPRAGWDLSDGSGMSSYNRVSPRTGVALLGWVEAQPWGAAWRATLPVGGTDGTLSRRFKGTAIEGRVFAKTGTLNATNALSGYLTAKSGRTLRFSFFANDVPEDVAATKAMDAALEMIAEAN